ncbi:hypothetical protein M378DRAFT_423269 [Amanita muscaria Koide BX008]|uniref:Uncharacterized protein n=1 Tax=Amanita muscaria (strain Koide BX008) TaxID=946122 RepID=A0A0C2S307_AMAMK|nr:hypothetical protein M378DRAFT_423269 [Amanita muscaria Koide BX008]
MRVHSMSSAHNPLRLPRSISVIVRFTQVRILSSKSINVICNRFWRYSMVHTCTVLVSSGDCILTLQEVS